METDDSAHQILANLNQTLQESKILPKIIADHKELHAPISKLGKIIDKTFRADIEKASRQVKFDNNILNEVVAQHLYRQGRFDLGDMYSEAAHIDTRHAQHLRDPFKEMFQVLRSIKERDLKPAIRWAVANRAELEKIGSPLEFRLHRVQFIDLLAAGKQQEALAYARAHFAEFANSQLTEIQHLMGGFLYAHRLNQSPYTDLFHPSTMPSLWNDIVTQFSRDCCSLLGLPQESPIFVCVTAGFKALPTFIKLASFQMLKIATQETATVEVDLGPDYQFHSVFACPVSREQSTKDSPPMMLVCGHVIGKVSMLKLIKGSSSRFKCPYCPTEQTLSQAKQVYF